MHSYFIPITCSLNPKLQSRFGALNDLVNSIQVIEPFQNGSSVGTRIGKQFFGSYDATDNTLLKFNHCKLIQGIINCFYSHSVNIYLLGNSVPLQHVSSKLMSSN